MIISQIHQFIASLKKLYKETYGEAIFEIKPQLTRQKLLLTGLVLLPVQIDDLLMALKKVFSGSIQNKIRTLSDFKNKPRLGWGRVEHHNQTKTNHIKPGRNVDSINKETIVVDVLRHPFFNKKDGLVQSLGRNCSTQVTVDDPPLALLWESGGWYLVRLIDGTIGWVEKNKIVKISLRQGGWKKWRNRKFRPISKAFFQEQSNHYLNTPYLLGGTTRQGIDCSGLTQRLYYQAFNLIIPKKSTEQKKRLAKIFGQRPGRSLLFGDLLFFEAKNHKKTSHVGICYEGKGQLILHSCFRHKKVTIEPLTVMRKYYQLLTVVRGR